MAVIYTLTENLMEGIRSFQTFLALVQCSTAHTMTRSCITAKGIFLESTMYATLTLISAHFCLFYFWEICFATRVKANVI